MGLLVEAAKHKHDIAKETILNASFKRTHGGPIQYSFIVGAINYQFNLRPSLGR